MASTLESFKMIKTKKSSPKIEKDLFVIPQGLEPWLAVPKTDVLPLHHGTIDIAGANLQ